MHRILVSNDDGVYAAGLRAAAKGVQGLGQVVVAAPSGQKSGVGRSISVFEPLRYAEVNLNGLGPMLSLERLSIQLSSASLPS